MNPWMRNLLCGGGGGGGGAALPPTGRTMLANLTSSLILDEGTGGPTWSRATKAWGFNELGYLVELASGCAFFGGARLVRNRVVTKSEDFSNAAWGKTNITTASVVDVPAKYTTAFSLIPTAVPGQHYISNTAGTPVSTTGTAYIVSVIAKAFGYSHLFFFTSNAAVYFDLSAGTVGSATGSSVGSTSIISLGNGWYECRIRCINLTGTNFEIHSTPSNGVFNYLGDGVSGAKISAVSFVDVTNYDASYVPEYVSVGVLSAPFHGAGIDGAKYFETDWQGAPIPAANLLGFRREASATNNLLHSRDLSNAAWSTKTNITAAKTATGLDGIANTATTLTATAADAIILQPITLASAARCASAYVKRRTGTGTISFTQDGGGSWTDITSQINSSTWSRVQITATLANPSVGFKISTSGDAIDVDCVQNEAGSVATSPIVTTTATITRNADSLTFQTASNIDFAVGTLYCETQIASSLTSRRAVLVGSDGFSYINTGDANTVWKAYDGTNIVIKSGLSDISTGKRKRAIAWGTGLKVTGDGLSPASGSFDGSFGSGATIIIGQSINGYVGPVAIYNYQMTDAELQAITA